MVQIVKCSLINHLSITHQFLPRPLMRNHMTTVVLTMVHDAQIQPASRQLYQSSCSLPLNILPSTTHPLSLVEFKFFTRSHLYPSRWIAGVQVSDFSPFLSAVDFVRLAPTTHCWLVTNTCSGFHMNELSSMVT